MTGRNAKKASYKAEHLPNNPHGCLHAYLRHGLRSTHNFEVGMVYNQHYFTRKYKKVKRGDHTLLAKLRTEKNKGRLKILKNGPHYTCSPATNSNRILSTGDRVTQKSRLSQWWRLVFNKDSRSGNDICLNFCVTDIVLQLYSVIFLVLN